MRGQLLGDAEAKDARWRLGKACHNIERKRAAEAKRLDRGSARVTGPRLYATAPPYHHVLGEADVLSASKAVVLTGGSCAHSAPWRALASLARAAHESASLVVTVEVTADLMQGWVEESSLCVPGPVSKPLLRALRVLGRGTALVAIGAESCSLLSKIAQDPLVASAFPVVMLVQPCLSSLKMGALGALSRLPLVLVLSQSRSAPPDLQRLRDLFPHSVLRVCSDGPLPEGIDLRKHALQKGPLTQASDLLTHLCL